MSDINLNRKRWNEQQKLLQQALLRGNDHPRAIEFFLAQPSAPAPIRHNFLYSNEALRIGQQLR